MAHTYRNRHAVPHGYEVRDGGYLFYPTCCPNKKAQRASWQTSRGYYNEQDGEHDRCPCHPRWNECNFRGKLMRKERKAERKEHYKSYRAKVKDRMRHEDWENIPEFCRTSGWLTW
jgi:hypothetical protein